jgi:hypothetical protein
MKKNSVLLIPVVLFYSLTVSSSCNNNNPASKNDQQAQPGDSSKVKTANTAVTPVDTADYNKKMLALANGDTTGRWPAKAPYPLAGAVFPDHRIVAFYGNLFSKNMGILGELPKDSMLRKLKGEVAKWQASDSSFKVIPALHYIAVTAQGSPGADGKYRLRMPFAQVDTIVHWAKEIGGLVFIDIQTGSSTVKDEISRFGDYLKLPNVHFGIDPEFSMKNGKRPGTVIGSFNADEINDAIDYLASVVKANNLPPKILIVHRFTQGMVTDYQRIKKLPEVQVVMDMDGWGPKVLKRSTWLRYINREPVEFTGFKLFYKNDTKTGKEQMYSPEELNKFIPKPVYIQYQ